MGIITETHSGWVYLSYMIGQEVDEIVSEVCKSKEFRDDVMSVFQCTVMYNVVSSFCSGNARCVQYI